jgi:hypothetical protein
MKIKEGSNRIAAIDEIRGIAILGMLFFMAVYYEMIFRAFIRIRQNSLGGVRTNRGRWIVYFYFRCQLLLFKKQYPKRIICFGFGLVISAITLILWKGFGQQNTFIFFGILHLLGVSMIVFGLTENVIKKSTEKRNPLIGLVVFAGLFAISYLMVYKDLWEQAIFSLKPVETSVSLESLICCRLSQLVSISAH